MSNAWWPQVRAVFWRYSAPATTAGGSHCPQCKCPASETSTTVTTSGLSFVSLSNPVCQSPTVVALARPSKELEALDPIPPLVLATVPDSRPFSPVNGAQPQKHRNASRAFATPDDPVIAAPGDVIAPRIPPRIAEDALKCITPGMSDRYERKRIMYVSFVKKFPSKFTVLNITRDPPAGKDWIIEGWTNKFDVL